MQFEIVDPYRLKTFMGTECSKPARPPKDVTDPDALALWNEVMVNVSSYGRKILPMPITATRSLGDTVQKFLNDPERNERKFGQEKLTAKQVYESIGMSRATWGRLTGGKDTDVERGNVFAIAIGLRLNEAEVQELLYSAGFALNYSLELDAAMMYFIKQEIYDMKYIHDVLSKFSNIDNGLDCFRLRPLQEKK